MKMKRDDDTALDFTNLSTLSTDEYTMPEPSSAQTNKRAETEHALSARIQELEAKLAEAEAAVLYVKAESENIRRRALDDSEKARKFALERFASDLLAVKDSLDAALSLDATLSGEANELNAYKDGVNLTARQLTGVFEKFNITEIDPLGEKFDPNKHQAIKMESSKEASNTVISVLQKGYALHERILRPALVTVAQ